MLPLHYRVTEIRPHAFLIGAKAVKAKGKTPRRYWKMRRLECFRSRYASRSIVSSSRRPESIQTASPTRLIYPSSHEARPLDKRPSMRDKRRILRAGNILSSESKTAPKPTELAPWVHHKQLFRLQSLELGLPQVILRP